MRELLENANINDQAKFTDTFEHANAFIAKIDEDPSLSYSKASPGLASDLKITSTGINDLIENHFEEHYGIEGITYDNIEQVYNPKISGIQTLAETRDYLIQHGMTDSLTEQLLQQYLRKVTESSQIFSLLDLFSCSKAKAAINKAPIEDICINYI